MLVFRRNAHFLQYDAVTEMKSPVEQNILASRRAAFMNKDSMKTNMSIRRGISLIILLHRWRFASMAADTSRTAYQSLSWLCEGARRGMVAGLRGRDR